MCRAGYRPGLHTEDVKRSPPRPPARKRGRTTKALGRRSEKACLISSTVVSLEQLLAPYASSCFGSMFKQIFYPRLGQDTCACGTYVADGTWRARQQVRRTVSIEPARHRIPRYDPARFNRGHGPFDRSAAPHPPEGIVFFFSLCLLLLFGSLPFGSQQIMPPDLYNPQIYRMQDPD